ncbi:MAG: hypothetical protein ACOX6Q_03190 [Candidatus Dojkabacteria bacterium]|jgi:hypothetical protein
MEKEKNPKQEGKTSHNAKERKLTLGIIILLFIIILLLLFIMFTNKQKNIDSKGEKEKISEEKDEIKELEPTVYCPGGYEIENDICKKETIKPASSNLVCPDGTVEVGPDGPCGTYKQKAEPTQRCPMGTIYQVEIKTLYYCYTRERKGENCGEDPESSYFADNKCYYARIDSETTYSCPADMVSYKGDCYTKANKINKYSCDSGFTLKNSNCIKVEKTEQQKDCPVGYELKTDKCVFQK